MLTVFCSNDFDFFKGNFKCYSKNHLIFFVISILCILCLLSICLIYSSFFFKKIEDSNYEMVKFLVVNTLKNSFYLKATASIVGGINMKYSCTGFSVFAIFVTSLYDSFNIRKEFIYMDQDDNKYQFLYFFHFIHFFSSCLLMIGYLFRNHELKGLFYVLFILIFIFLTLIIGQINQKKLFPFSYIISNINNELILFHQANLLTRAVEKRTLSRDVFLNLMSYFSQFKIHDGYKFEFFDENNKIIHSEDLDYYLYQAIDLYYKASIHQNINSILIKISYSNFLRHKLKRFTKAYMILNDIIEGNYYLSPSQEFYFYRLKRKIEDRFIETGIDSSEISIKYQCNSFIHLISKVSEIYLDFWNLLLTGKSDDNISLLSEFGNEINNLIDEIEYKYQYISKLKVKNKKIIILYGYFLRDILNDVELSSKILTKELIKEAKDEEIDYLEYEIDTMVPSSSFQYMVVSAKKGQIGIIKKISLEICRKLGYSEKDLIGQNINIIVPDFLRNEHQILLDHQLENLKFKEDNLSLPAIFNHCVFCKTVSKFLVEIPLEVRIGFDEELIPFLLCKLNVENDLYSIKNLNYNFHVLTNEKYIIQNFTSNCLEGLQLNYRSINNNTELISQIKEFHDEYFKKAMNIKRKEKRNKIKYSILKKKYMTQFPVEVITWLKNGKQFIMNCRKVKMNGKILGFFFHFSTNKINEFSSLQQSINHQSSLIQIPKTPIEAYKTKFDKRLSLSNYMYKGNQLNLEEEFLIEKNFLPNSNKVDFDIYDRKYLFRKKENFQKIKIKSIESYFKEEILNKNKPIKNYEEEEISEETDEEEYESEENLSSSFSSLQEEKTEKKIIAPRRKKENIFREAEISNIKYYNVNLKNISYFLYDFNLKMPIEFKGNFIGKIDELITIEKKKSLKIILNNNKKNIKEKKKPHIINKFKKQFANKALNDIIEKHRIKNVNEIIKGLNDYLHQFKSANISKLFITLVFSSLFSLAIITYSLLFLFDSKGILVNLGKIFAHISDLIESSHMVLFYSYELVLLENHKYYNFFESREEKIEKSKENLLKSYNVYSNFSSLLHSDNLKLTKKNSEKINNLSFVYYQMDSNGYYNIKESPFLNILLEYTFSIFNLVSKEKSDIALNNNLDFFFIIYNSNIFSLSNLNYLIDIFNDQFFYEKKKTTIFLILMDVLFVFFQIIFFILEYKIYKNVLKENERYFKYFFQIDDEHIRYSIIKCKKYSMLNQENSSNVKYLIGNPIINFGSYKDIDSEEDSLLDLSHDLINQKSNQQNTFNFTITNVNLKKKQNHEIQKFVLINIIISIIIIIFLIILIIIFRNKSFRILLMKNLYDLIVAKKSVFIEYFNYLRIYMGNLIDSFNSPYINSAKEKIHSSLDEITDYITYINVLLYGNITKYGVSQNTTNKFKNIINYSLCDFFSNFSQYYGYKCENLAYNISNYGLNSLYIYLAHSINDLKEKFDKLSNIAEMKGYFYNEAFYGSEFYELFYPDNPELKEDYESSNPFLLFNDDNMRDLEILSEYIFNPASSFLSDTVSGEYNEIIKVMGKYFTIIGIISTLLVILFFIIYSFPSLTNKIEQLKKTRKLIKIIPKDILSELVKKEQEINDE